MARRLKLLAGLSTLAATGALTLAGCSQGDDGAAPATGADSDAHAAHQAAAAGAEGAGGESEGATAADAAADNVVYLTQLILIRGHLQAGAALFASGDKAMATTHMKHPKDELYADLMPAFAARNHPGFAGELTALSTSVENGESAETVERNLAAVRTAIDDAMAAANASPKEQLLAIAAALNTAGEEFDIGVKDGAIVNAHEYQDAYGFMTVAVELLGRMESGGGDLDAAIAAAREQAAIALQVAPGVIPPEMVTTSSQTIYGAAARMELLARGVD